MMQRVSWAVVMSVCGAFAASEPLPAPVMGGQGTERPVTLEVRVFDGTNEVTSETRVRVFEAGAQTNPRTIRVASGAATAELPVGFYDLQAVRERDGQIAGIRWAKQRLVQRYPNQPGYHLEVINLQPGYGALQIRRASAAEAGAVAWRARIHPSGDSTREAGASSTGDGYLLFVVPAGTYDVQVLAPGGAPIWIREVEIPADQTQLATWK